MSTIPASQIVSVIPSVVPAGGNAIALNGLVLTTNVRVPVGTVASFSSLKAVQDFFGASDPLAVGAEVYFAGYDGSTKRPGALLIAQYPLAAVGAYLRGGNLSAVPLATLKTYSGSLNVTVDGYPRNAASVNLSAATSFSSAAGIIQTQLNAADPSEATVTASIGATGLGTGSGTTLTMASVTGLISVGDAVTGTGAPANTVITALGTGTGGNGTYITNNATTSIGAPLTISSNVLDVTAVGSGSIAVGQTATGAGVTSAIVTALGTGTGGAGTYVISGSPQQVASEAMVLEGTPVVVTYDSVSGGFIVSSGITGAPSTAAFATGTIAANLMLTAATGAVVSQGAAAAVPATFMAAVIAITTNWALFMTAFNPDNSGFANKLLFSAWANSTQNRFGYVPFDSQVSATQSAPDTTCFAYAVNQAGYSGTIPVWEPSDLEHCWFVLGWAASLDVERTNGRASLAFRSQSGLVAGVTDGTVAENLGGNPQVAGDRGNGYNFYGVYGSGNQNDTFMNRGFISGPFLFADSYVNQIWGNNLIQAALMTYLRSAGTTPFNATGYTTIEEALSGAIAAMGNFGVFVPGVTLSASQISDVNAAAGKNIATTLQTRGWYLQINPASPTTRASRGPISGTFWYTDGQSIQSISLASVAVL